MTRAAAVACLAALCAILGAAAAFPWLRGYALYHGYARLSGRIAGIELDLPPAALICANCHDARSASGVRRIAALDRTALTDPQARRGGPPSVYDEAAFCKAAREGADPASVTIERVMPRFALADAECAALWRYVSAR